jgi:oxaloacetate decarboxylase gamma subunit
MNEMMSSGIELMLMGMGSVFLFLALLVFAIKTMAAIIARYFPDPTIELAMPKKDTDPLVIAAISAAVHQYRSKNSTHLS